MVYSPQFPDDGGWQWMIWTYGSSSCKDLKYNYASRNINRCVVLIYFRRNTSGMAELHNYFNPY